MNIALAQIDIKAGDPKANVDKMLKYIAKAKSEEADVIAFPEMAVGGYLLGDLWLDDEYCRYLMEFNEQIIEASEGIVVIWGNVYLEERDKLYRVDPGDYMGTSFRNVHRDGRKRRYNTAYAYQNKTPMKRYQQSAAIPDGMQFKSLLPNYREFDDKRYFASTLDLIESGCIEEYEACTPFEMNFKGEVYRIAVELCEDLWCEDYDFNPTKIMHKRSDVIINLSSSPWTYGKNKARDRRVKKVINWRVEGTVPFYYVNCVGVQNNGKNFFTFDGGSTVYGLDGRPKVLAKKPYEEELIICNSNEIPTLTAKRKNRMMIEDKYLAIVRGIQHLRDMLGFEKYTIGLSGGIDSAVVACLLVKAVGKENVLAINMPSKYNSDRTKVAAEKIARRLGINYEVVSIEAMNKENINSILNFVDPRDNRVDLLAENIQAKIRGTSLLSNIAEATGSLFTNNGNKVETALGYATLYGDVGGAVSPIADLTKEEVYKMAWYLNDECFKKNPIPKNLLPNKYYQFESNQIQPSAELKDAQVDPIKIGYHCKLVEQFMDYMKKSPVDIMQWWLDGVLPEKLGMSEELMEIYELRDARIFLDDLEWFCRQMRANVFKRVQSPPNIVVSKTAFGYDLRESILPWFRFTSKEQELYDKISDTGWY